MTKMGRSGLILALNLVLAVVAFAQTGSIKGTLVDSQGGVIAGASVRAMDQAKGTTVRETTSGPDGLFELQPLLPGTYVLSVGSAVTGHAILSSPAYAADTSVQRGATSAGPCAGGTEGFTCPSSDNTSTLYVQTRDNTGTPATRTPTSTTSGRIRRGSWSSQRASFSRGCRGLTRP